MSTSGVSTCFNRVEEINAMVHVYKADMTIFLSSQSLNYGVVNTCHGCQYGNHSPGQEDWQLSRLV